MKRFYALAFLGALCLWTGIVARIAQHPDGMVWRNLSPVVWFLQGVPLEATYTPSAIKSIHGGTISIIDAASTNTSTFAAVTVANSAVVFTGQQATDTNNQVAYFACLDLTNTTTVTATRAGGVTGSVVVSYQVVEFLSQFIKSRQPNTIVMTDGGAASNTSTVSSVNTAKSWLVYGGSCSSGGITSGNAVNSVIAGLVLTNATTVTANRTSTAGTGSTTGFTLMEFK